MRTRITWSAAGRRRVSGVDLDEAATRSGSSATTGVEVEVELDAAIVVVGRHVDGRDDD